MLSVAIFLFLTVVNAWTRVETNNFSLVGSFLLCLVLRFFTYRHLSLKRNTGVCFLFFYFETSFFLHIFLKNRLLGVENFSDVIFYGESVISILSIFYLASLKVKLPSESLGMVKRIRLPEKFLDAKGMIACFLCVFLFSYLSFKLGITKLGAKHAELPFKLEPSLNLLRTYIIPYFFLLLFDSFSNEKSKKKCYVSMAIFFAWSVLEAYIRHSRGVFLFNFSMIIFFLILGGLSKKVISILILFLLLLPILFGIGNYYRLEQRRNYFISHNDPQYQEFIDSIKPESAFRFDGAKVWLIFNRIFSEASLLKKIAESEKLSFFVNNTKLLKKYKGSVPYHTHVIDKVPLPGNNDKTPAYYRNSSGITALTDGYLLFGKVGIILSVFVLFILSFANDQGLLGLFSSNRSFRIINIYWIIKLTIWDDGLFSFYLFRSIYTISFFPIFLLFIWLICRNNSQENQSVLRA